MIASSPALLAREAQILAQYTDAMASATAEETGAGRDDPRPWITANALIGVHRALLAYLRHRVLAGPTAFPTAAFPTSPATSAPTARPRLRSSRADSATTAPNARTPARRRAPASAHVLLISFLCRPVLVQTGLIFSGGVETVGHVGHVGTAAATAGARPPHAAAPAGGDR
jgi:hypothetical protein